MARLLRCDRCHHDDDGTLAGRVTVHHYSPGYTTVAVDVCNTCAPKITFSQALKLGRRVGAGHLQGVEQLRSLPIAKHRDAPGG